MCLVIENFFSSGCSFVGELLLTMIFASPLDSTFLFETVFLDLCPTKSSEAGNVPKWAALEVPSH